MKSFCFAALRFLLLLAFLLSIGGSISRAWGCKGHQTIALIAEKQLTPEARKFILGLLEENPVDPELKRNCGNPEHDLVADASTWPDDVRGRLKNGPWHYINIPRGVSRSPLAQFCGSESCITQAIADQLAILKDKDAEPRLRADAVRYLIHFVGDLHMPLHASTNNDEGGNCVPVRYLRRRPLEHDGSFTPNLHSLWDTTLVERDMEGAGPPEYAEFLEQAFSSDFSKWQAAGIHVDDWAWESHDLAETKVYGALVPEVPVEAPATVHSCTDANNIGERMLRLNLFAGQGYDDSAAPIIERRIAQAGVRLAMIFNQAAASVELPGQSASLASFLAKHSAGSLE
jgi:S1/P1 Nuclease